MAAYQPAHPSSSSLRLIGGTKYFARHGSDGGGEVGSDLTVLGSILTVLGSS
jgi:hypothetical protein